MVISFKRQFLKPMVEGTKVATIREEKQSRWKAGMIMHMVTGIRSKKYKCLMTVFQNCISVFVDYN